MKRIGPFSASVGFHLFLLMIGGIFLVKPLEYGVEVGANAMEINLVASAVSVEEEVVPEPAETESEIKPTAVPQFAAENPGKDQVTIQSTGGAIVEAKPDYLANPAPRYPYRARQKGWQGTVILRTAVDRQGHPTQVSVERSSGYDILDEAAVKAVETWKFRPAQLSALAVESVVKIPIRFDLKDTQ